MSCGFIAKVFHEGSGLFVKPSTPETISEKDDQHVGYYKSFVEFKYGTTALITLLFNKCRSIFN